MTGIGKRRAVSRREISRGLHGLAIYDHNDLPARSTGRRAQASGDAIKANVRPLNLDASFVGPCSL